MTYNLKTIIDNEGNSKKFESNGFKCIIVRHDQLGFLCGYVLLPLTHSLYGVDYSHIDVDVHGGLTYSNFDAYENQPMWALGFDCGHIDDIVPVMHLKSNTNKLEDLDIIGNATYKDMEFVYDQLVELTEQLK